MNNHPCIYILGEGPEGAFFVGATRELVPVLYRIKSAASSGDGAQVPKQLVYFERCKDMMSAVLRRQDIRHYSKRYTRYLVEQMNPEWRDLSSDIL